MNIAYIYADSQLEWNTSNWLCHIPAEGMSNVGHQVFMLPIPMFDANAPECVEALEKCQIIVIERNYRAITMAMIQHWRMKGKLIIGVFDDAYHLMEKSNKAYPYWIEGKIMPVDDKGQRLKDEKGNPKGTQIKGPIAREVLERWPTVAKLASAVY